MNMKEFLSLANCTFMADDIDDAMKQLEMHFWRIRNGKDSSLLTSGEISLSRNDGSPAKLDN